MLKERLFDVSGNYTPVALNISEEMSAALQAILDRYPEYDMRDLQHIVQGAAFDAGLVMVIKRKREL